jgi:AcrR family transcriptional regulator
MAEGVELLDEPKSETKGERTRQRLLELAIERFGERGYRGTSVSEIARAAGLTQAAVYAYFPSKEGLFEAAVDEDASSIIERARERSVGVEVHALVPTLLIHFLGLLEDHPLVSRILGGNEREQLGRLVNLPSLHELTDWVAGVVEEAQETGAARTDIDASAFADGAETLLLGLLMAITQVGGTTEARRQIGVLTLFDRVLRVPA